MGDTYAIADVHQMRVQAIRKLGYLCRKCEIRHYDYLRAMRRSSRNCEERKRMMAKSNHYSTKHASMFIFIFFFLSPSFEK